MKRSREREDTICFHLSKGLFRKRACAAAGISEDAFSLWCKSDPDFAQRVSDAEASYQRFLLDIVERELVESPTSGKLALELLARRFPREWGISDAKKEAIATPQRTAQDLFSKDVLDEELRALQAKS